MIRLDGLHSGGFQLRAALTLAGATGQPFQLENFRARQPRPGLLPEHLGVVRAAAMTCQAKVSGGFDGSRELHFDPGAVSAGRFRFECVGQSPAPSVIQTVVPILAEAAEPSRVEVTGATHLAESPCFEFVDRPWRRLLERMGLRIELRMAEAAFRPAGGGEIHARVAPRDGRGAVHLEQRGALEVVRGVSGAGRLRGDVAARYADACRRWLWEERRLVAEWEVLSVPAASPGAYLFLDAQFEHGAAGLTLLGERGASAEQMGERAGRRLLKFMEADTGALDPYLAEQLVVPLMLAGGGCLTTVEVTGRLQILAGVAEAFGVRSRTFGRRGGPGGIEVAY